MRVNPDRLVPSPDADNVWMVYAKADNREIFHGRAEVWPFILDLPKQLHFADTGPLDAESPAELVQVYESAVGFVDKSDLRRELTPLVVRPDGYRRLLRIAWAMSERIEHTPISLSKAGIVEKGRRFPRIAAPGAPGQALAFARRFSEYPCNAARFVVVTWQSRRVVTSLK